MRHSPIHSITGARWNFGTKEGDSSPTPTATQTKQLATELDVDLLLAGVLAARGFDTAASARAFLSADPEGLHDPMLLPDMAAGVELISEALDNKAKILVHGDYDVDGMTSCALLQRALTALGGDVATHLPHRIADGYGLGRAAIEEAAAAGTTLLITADCGTGAEAEIEYAHSLGMQVVVTDHHHTERSGKSTEAPEINPQREDSEYPFVNLSGVGVAFKLVEALAERRGVPPRAHWRFLDLVALGTVADVSPLVGENRILVKKGLEVIGNSQKVGLCSLIRATRLAPPISSRQVAFVLAPRLNAAGRLAHPREALDLLVTMDEAEAEKIAETLCQHNLARQKEEARTLEEAREKIAKESRGNDPVLVLARRGWHQGVIGIVASRLVERYRRPVLLVSLPEEAGREEGIGVGSARSVPGFPLWEALDHCRELLERFGGHEQAAGFSVKESKIDVLREMLCGLAEGWLEEEQSLPVLDIDLLVEASALTLNSVEELGWLEPFGEGNPSPTIAVKDLSIKEMAQVGQEGRHLRMLLQDEAGIGLRTIWFREGERANELRCGDRVDVCLSPTVSKWNGAKTLELRIKDAARRSRL